MQANYIDHVLIKSDGFPSYHLAHIVDDYLMGTTHIIRADEWLASVPFHIQLFQGFKDIFTRPQRSYNHNSPIQKLDNGNRRKLSKRKDPEADVQTLIDAGYPAEGIKTYLMCLLNSNFEDWRVQSNA
jgi:glutamyl/glutaminyl-tRNA synthetase